MSFKLNDNVLNALRNLEGFLGLPINIIECQNKMERERNFVELQSYLSAVSGHEADMSPYQGMTAGQLREEMGKRRAIDNLRDTMYLTFDKAPDMTPFESMTSGEIELFHMVIREDIPIGKTSARLAKALGVSHEHLKSMRL